MAATWTFSMSVILLVTGSTLGNLTMEPENPVVRPGELVRLMCRSSSPISQCLWEISDELYNPGTDGKYRRFGSMENGECGVEAEVTENDNGKWQCRVFANAGNSLRAATNVTVVAVPRLSLRPSADPISTTAGQETEVTCSVEGARPAPAVIWMIGDREIDNPSKPTDTMGSNGYHSISSTLRHAFEPRDHGESLRCLATGPWFNADDSREASARLNVLFAPQSKGPATLYGFVAGQPGDVVVNFTANPKPHRVFWTLDDATELQVEPAGPRGAADQRYEVSDLNTLNAQTYEARLRIRAISEADARRTFRLKVMSDLNGEERTEEYLVRVSLSSAPAQTGGIGGGAIAGIIIAVLALLVLASAVVYARNTGRWCFAGASRTVGEGESQARIDAENPGEITKDKEGKEGPLKGSTEHLNLELATQTNENGNMPPSPVKETQQSNGAGGNSPVKDGKDTPV